MCRGAPAFVPGVRRAARYGGRVLSVQIVFQEFRLARGNWSVRGQSVRPQDIRTTALLTIEGELDDVSGRGQTQAAQDLCAGIATRHKRHFTARQCGHYDLFSGPHWRTEVYPIVRDLIRQYDLFQWLPMNRDSRATLHVDPDPVRRRRVPRAKHVQNL